MKKSVWNEFIEHLTTEHFEDYKTTKEHFLWKNRMDQINEILSTNLTKDEKLLIEEILFETSEQQEHYADILYEQGMKDCICILKNLSII